MVYLRFHTKLYIRVLQIDVIVIKRKQHPVACQIHGMCHRHIVDRTKSWSRYSSLSNPFRYAP